MENGYHVEDLLNTLEGNLFKELNQNQPISFSRRRLQKNYIDGLIRDLSPDKSAVTSQLQSILGGEYSDSDVPSLVRGHLMSLKTKLASAVKTNADAMSKYHLQDLLYRVNKALDMQ